MNTDTGLPLPPGHKQKVSPLYYRLIAGSRLLRLSSPAHVKSLFNPYGPVSRFDCHPEGQVQKHPEFSACYLAETLKSCIAEVALGPYVKGPVNGSLSSNRILVEVEVTRDLELLDLSGDGPLKAGTRHGILDEYQKRSITQEWARRFYVDPFEEYQRIDGIRWPSAKNGMMVYVIYTRAGDGVNITKESAISLKPLRTEVMRICREYKIEFV